MPTSHVPSGQDWAPVNVGRSSIASKPTTVPKSAAALEAAKASGAVVTEKRYGAGGNPASTSLSGTMVMSARKLEESEDLRHATVDRSLSKAIMQARMAKNMTQKDLATAINEKPQIIGEYENGKAIPSGALIAKIERVLGCKLPRPNKAPSSSGSGTGGAISGGGGSSSASSQKASANSASALTRGGPPKRR